MVIGGEGVDRMPRGGHGGGLQRSETALVLLVDGDATRRRSLARALSAEGLEVFVAESGAQALGMLHGQSFDAVILDSELPHRGGVQAVQRVKADEELRDVVVVVLGDAADSIGCRQALQAGAEAFLSRDLDVAELSLRLRNLTQLRAGYRGLQKRNAALSRLLQDESQRAMYFEQFSRNTLDAASGQVVVLDGKGVLVAVNQAWLEFMQEVGCGAQEAGIGSPYRAQCFVTDPAEAQRLMDSVLRVANGNCEDVSHEYESTRCQPSRWFRARIARFKETPSPHVMITHEDVTRQRETLGALERSAEKLQESQSHMMHAQKMEAVGRLVGGVSHDFNNMLTSIICFTRFVVDEMAPEDPRRADLVEVLRAADSAARLTNQLLTFSRRRPVQAIVLDLNAALTSVGRVLGRALGQSVELVILPIDEGTYALCDPGQFDQLLFNLAIHAKDEMMPGGGTITVKLGHVRVGDADCVELLVSDTSEGMSSAEVAAAFDPFAALQVERAGGGLDLAACAGIVQQAGGQISASSVLGRGTTYRVLLPRVHEAKKADAARHSLQAQAGLHGTALVVEDQPAILRTMSRALKSAGLTVLEATSAEDALAMLTGRESLPELLVTDMMLPGMSGAHLVERLRGRGPELPVLFVSGYAGYEANHSIRVDEKTAFVAKPFTGRQLVARAAALLQPRS